LDLYLANGGQPNRLYRNEGNANQWLQVKLTGTESSKDGIGAQVVAVTADLRQRRDVDGGSGYLSQSSLAVEFGLGSVASADSLIVTWPSGQVQTLTEVAANQVLEVVQEEVTEPEIALPFPPILSFPANQATNQPIEFTLRWNASLGGADSYDLQVADNEGFSNPLIDQAGITDTFLPVSGLAGSTTYYWRVRAVNAARASDWTGGRQFTTIEVEVDEGQIIVDTTADLADFGGSQGVRDLPGADGIVSLREAIIAANNTAGPQTIAFNIPTSDSGFDGSVFTIQPADSLSSLTDAGTTIDGATQTAFSGDTNVNGPELVINGDLLANTNNAGLAVLSGANIIHSLVINGFREGFGIFFFGFPEAIEDNIITGCFIGTDPSGTVSVPNQFGLLIAGNNVSNTRIGGATAAERNVISGNTTGMRIQSGGGNLVQGNFFGTSADGMDLLPNESVGVDLWSGTQNNRIVGNLVSGNTVGISFFEAGEGNWIQGNLIGTNAVQAPVLGNRIAGIDIDDTDATRVGGLEEDEGNFIAGNGASGIRIFNANNNVIEGNTITENEGHGVILSFGGDAEFSVGNSILRNRIFANGGRGIVLGLDGPPANDAGDVDIGMNNLMNFPVLNSAQSDGEALIVAGAIDAVDPQTVTIEIFANPVPEPGGDPTGYGEGAQYLGEVTPDASGEFTVFLPAVELGTLISATATDAEGNTSEFALNIVAESVGEKEDPPTEIIVNTTLDIVDFGDAQQVSDLPGNDGLVSLHEGLIAANNTTGSQTVSFNIPTSDSGFDGSVFTLQPTDANPLPTLTDDGTIVNGSTQTAFSGDTNADGPEIVINGDLYSGSLGLVIDSSDNLIHGLVVNGFQNGIGIYISSFSRSIGDGAEEGNVVTGCFIGTDPSGTVSVPNFSGLSLGQNTRNARIGGETAAERNVVSGNSNTGIIIDRSSDNLIQGNFVGTSASGMDPLGNAFGISGGGFEQSDEAQNNRIVGNLISGNEFVGVLLTTVENNWIQGNLIGTNADREPLLGNGDWGIEVATDAKGNRIGGLEENEGNFIAANGGGGIRISSSNNNIVEGNTIAENEGAGVALYVFGDTEPGVGNTIRRNSIFDNRGLGIDIGWDGRTANDAGDVDSGINGLMNFPILTSAVSDEELQIVGTIDTPIPENVVIEFFANRVPEPGGDPTGYGEGAQFLGAVMPDANGSFTASLAAVEVGTLISATATDAAGNTSEFALNIVVESGETEIVVNTTLDLVDFDAPQQMNDLPGSDGLVTLREALLAAVNTSGPEKIIFNIPTSDGGFDGSTFTIRPQTSPLPILRGDAIIIDGSSQTQFSGDTNQAGPEIVINGSEAPGGSGIFMESSGHTIHALVINGFDGGQGILVIEDLGEGGDILGEDNIITGCFIGTDPTGTTEVPNDFGIVLENTRNMRIGGKTAAERNIISGNIVGILAFESSNNLVQENFIGTDVSGMNPLGNTFGVILDGDDGETENNRIIGNLISYNGTGILLDASNNIVQGNLIGTNTDGDPVFGNVVSGIEIRSNANNNVIGGGRRKGELYRRPAGRGRNPDYGRERDAYSGQYNNGKFYSRRQFVDRR